jgi:hypothetical protein
MVLADIIPTPFAHFSFVVRRTTKRNLRGGEAAPEILLR